MAAILNDVATEIYYFRPHLPARIEHESEKAMRNEAQLIQDYESEFFGDNANATGRNVLVFPVCRHKHWHLHIINAKHARVDLLSSTRWPKAPAESLKLTKRIGKILHLLGLFTDLDVQDFTHRVVDVSEQANGDDYGMFVLKFMQFWNGNELRADMLFDYGLMDVERLRMAMYFILHEQNKLYGDVLANIRKDQILLSINKKMQW